MLTLLPPSEGKVDGIHLNTEWVDELSFNSHLADRRHMLLKEIGMPIPSLLVSPAIDIYQGVLYKSLDFRSLPQTKQQVANSQVIIFSGLFGAIRPLDEIPNHKHKMRSSDWSDLLPAALSGLESELIVDCRSSTYSSVWKPNPAITVNIRVFQEISGVRSVITHMSKKYRGELTRALIEGPTLHSPHDLSQGASELFETQLHPPASGKPWILDLIIGL